MGINFEVIIITYFKLRENQNSQIRTLFFRFIITYFPDKELELERGRGFKTLAELETDNNNAIIDCPNKISR